MKRGYGPDAYCGGCFRINVLQSSKAGRLFLRFIDTAAKPPDIHNAAIEIAEHLDKWTDQASKLHDFLHPESYTPKIGPTGNPVMDLTGGRPDTPEWIAFMILTDMSNPHYDEYLDWIAGYPEDYDDTQINLLNKALSFVACNIKDNAQSNYKKAEDRISYGSWVDYDDYIEESDRSTK